MRGAKRALTLEEIRECFELKYEKGWSYQAIANKFGVDRSTITKYFNRFREFREFL